MSNTITEAELMNKMDNIKKHTAMKTITMYLHGNKETNFGIAEGLGIQPGSPAEEQFKYALYEVEFELEVDTSTGEYKICSVKENGQVLKPVREIM